MLCEEENQHDESNYFPFCYDSFEFLRQKSRASKQKQKLEDMNNAMEFVEVDNEKGEQVEYALRSNLSFYKKDDDQPSVVHEEYYNFFDEECPGPSSYYELCLWFFYRNI